MSAIKAVPSICHSCLRFIRPPRRLLVPRVPTLLLPIRKFHFSRPVRESVDGDLANASSESSPYNAPLSSDTPLPNVPPPDVPPPDDPPLDDPPPDVPSPPEIPKLTHSDIISLREHLDPNNLSAAYQRFVDLAATRVFPSKTSSGVGGYISHVTLQPTIDRLFEGIIVDGGKTADLPAPLDLLQKMKELEISSTNHYTTFLISKIRDDSSTEEILAAFDAAISFNSERLHEVMHETNELGSLTLDVATPYFIAFLVLHDKAVSSESLSQLESVLKNSPYPSAHHVDNFLDHHRFSDTSSSRILSLHDAFSQNTLFTHPHTLKLAISRATTPEALQALYTHIRTSPTPLTATIYSRFVTAFMEHKQPSIASTIWTDMTSSGITPTAVEWNDLMKALSKHQDSPILPLWTKMLQSGVIPDHHCWTTRIHSLLSSNRISEGLTSLRAMQDSNVTPTTETINAVLDGLLKHGHLPEASKVLSVAAKLGIRKDLWTYNTLLSSLLKQQKNDGGKFNDIVKLTRQMQSEGIVPDVQTVTVILDGMYKYSIAKPSLNSVLSLLEYVEASGIAVNVWTYTALLRALLAEGSEAAAMDILAIMDAKGMTGSTVTYTVLLKHYFLKRDLASVEKILGEVEEKGVAYDTRMWREVAWGFATMKQVERMKEVLERMHVGGGGMGLKGYMSVLLALQKGDLLREAKDLVEDLLKKGIVGGRRRDEGRREVEKGFWDVVRVLGEGRVIRELENTGMVDIEDE